MTVKEKKGIVERKIEEGVLKKKTKIVVLFNRTSGESSLLKKTPKGIFKTKKNNARLLCKGGLLHRHLIISNKRTKTI